jgi:hypothetical protein
MIDKYIELTLGFCKKHDNTLCLNLTDCRKTINEADRKPVRLKLMRDLLKQISRSDNKIHRQRRGILNFMGMVSHTLLGILDDEHESLYNYKIRQLDSEQANLMKVSKKQMIVAKSTLKSVTYTLQDVARN